jgi:nicotinic acid mononucleotide adenylyltransferase
MALKCQKIFITYGRFQPVTWGHENSFNAVKSAAQSAGCDYRIFISHKQEPKENPLSQGDKMMWMKLLLPQHAKKILAIDPSDPQKCVRYCMTASKDIAHDYDECVYMVGSDRVNAMQYLHNYNGCNPDRKNKGQPPDFSMKHFEIKSTGQRDADGKTFSISGTKMRNWARSGDITEFKKGLPKSNKLNDGQILEFMALL